MSDSLYSFFRNQFIYDMKLQSVGITEFTCPVSIREKNGSLQHTVATISLTAAMPHHVRENCVSVFIRALGRYRDDINAEIFPRLLAEVRDQLQAERAEMMMTFPYFIAKQAPVTRTSSLMEYECGFTGSLNNGPDLLQTVNVPLTTLCPCSKEISAAGAHNQRAEVKLTIRPLGFIWLEDLISMVEECGSCQLYALLKRPDEKYVTEKAYANPMFVEDVVRMVALQALARKDIGWFSVEVESFESIHKHSAYAQVDSNDLQ
jgi:GTP cyclohydrolase IB